MAKYPLGTVVNIAELPVDHTFVSSITVSDGRGSNIDTIARTVSATIGAGVTVVTYTNRVATTLPVGYIEVCKDASGEYVTGSFDFTITDSLGFTSNQSVLVGQCTEPIRVAAGNVKVTEAARFPYAVNGITVVPAARLVTKNLANQTATVVVPVGDTSTETLVRFANCTRTGKVKICKTIPLGSDALTGVAFRFAVTESVGAPSGDTVIAGAPGTTTCVFHAEDVPLGSTVTITELGFDNVKNTAVTVAPASQDAGSTPPTARLIVGTGTTTATFTNAALGTVEVCKAAADPSTAPQTFQFTVNGGAPISIHAGACSPAITVPVGTATIAEVAKTNFHLVGVTAVGPAQENRLTSAATANPAIVTVPFGGVENETLVTFTNAVDTGRFKICKQSSETTLQNVTFQFTAIYTNGVLIATNASLKPGQCSALSLPIPVVDANGNPIAVKVTEVQQPTVQVSSITVANGTLVSSDLPSGTAFVNVKTGNTIVTYTNVRTPFGTIQVCKAAADPTTATQTFNFSVNGTAPISVKAGQCSAVITVVSGTTTVSEAAKNNFEVAGITATGPGNVNRLVTGPTTNPATVTVPPGGASNKTVVTFTNAVIKTSVQICKASSEPTFQDRQFAFSFSLTGVSGTFPLKPGGCGTITGIPVIELNGNPTAFHIAETLDADVEIDSLLVLGTTASAPVLNTGAGTVDLTLTSSPVKVTYTNKLKAPAIRICKAAADTETAGVSFQFKILETTVRIVDVKAGECSDPYYLEPGTTSVQVEESPTTGYRVVNITATGPTGDDRLTAVSPTGLVATVSVGNGGVANMTTITFTNGHTPAIRICKAAADTETAGVSFQFKILETTVRIVDVKAGECSGPYYLDKGTTSVQVEESPTTGYRVVNITATGPTGDDRLTAVSPTGLVATVSVGNGGVANMTTITFTNGHTPAIRICKVAGDAGPRASRSSSRFSRPTCGSWTSRPVSARARTTSTRAPPRCRWRKARRLATESSTSPRPDRPATTASQPSHPPAWSRPSPSATAASPT